MLMLPSYETDERCKQNNLDEHIVFYGFESRSKIKVKTKSKMHITFTAEMTS